MGLAADCSTARLLGRAERRRPVVQTDDSLPLRAGVCVRGAHRRRRRGGRSCSTVLVGMSIYAMSPIGTLLREHAHGHGRRMCVLPCATYIDGPGQVLLGRRSRPAASDGNGSDCHRSPTVSHTSPSGRTSPCGPSGRARSAATIVCDAHPPRASCSVPSSDVVSALVRRTPCRLFDDKWAEELGLHSLPGPDPRRVSPRDSIDQRQRIEFIVDGASPVGAVGAYFLPSSSSPVVNMLATREGRV